MKVLTPPYLTISAQALPEGVQLITGQRVTAYWELPQALSATAWVGLVPTATPPTSQDSRAAALVAEDLAGRTKAMLPYQLMQPGIYVWRMFESNTPDSKPYLESEVFEVIQAPAAAKPGQ